MRELFCGEVSIIGLENKVKIVCFSDWIFKKSFSEKNIGRKLDVGKLIFEYIFELTTPQEK